MNKSNSKFDLHTFLKILPVLILTSIVPLIMIVKLYIVPEDIKHVMMKGDYIVDLYSYYKMVLIGSMGFYMTVILIKDFIRKKDNIKIFFKENKILITPVILMTLLILTTIFSPHKSVALNGLPERFEGFYAFYSYILLLFYIPYICKEYRYKLLIVYVTLTCSAIAVSIIGILEYNGYYIIESEWFKQISVFGKLKSMGININYSMDSKTLASTLYNSNYMGSYIVTVIFSAIALVVCMKEKPNYLKAILSITGISIFLITLIYSNSASGYFSIIVSFLVFIFLILFRIRNPKSFIITILIIILSLSAIYYEEFKLDRLGVIRTEFANFKAIKENPNPYRYVESIWVKDNILTIGYMGELLTIILDTNKGEIFFLDTDDNPLEYTMNTDNIFTTNVSPFNEIQLSLDTHTNIYTLKTIRWPSLNLKLILSNNGISYIDYYGNLISDNTDKTYPRWGFEDYERLATNRGYLWSISIPLLKDNLILGSGSDTYALVFPQDDIIGKLAYFRSQNAFIDKPHNLYLQLGITQGVLFTLIFVGLVLYLIIQLIKDLFKYRDKVSVERIAIMCGVIAYMIAGIANDSTVGTGPVFWSLLGISILHYIDDKETLSKI